LVANRYILFGFRLVVGGVFIWAAVLKIGDPLGFAQNIANYRLFPRFLDFILALTLPWIEVATGALLILGLGSRSSALISSVLLGSFIILVLTAVLRGIETDCGCFGSLSGKADLKLIAMDAVLLFFSINILLAKKKAVNREP